MTSHAETFADNRFAVGTFTPDPKPASPAAMLRSQGLMELKLLLRNGEQLLLTMLVPITMLIVFSEMPIGDISGKRIDSVLPAVMMVAIMSTGFTGQAIAVGFDRRYGALKRLGATALPRWGVIAGKCAAVVIVVILQSLLLGGIALVLGWRPDVVTLIFGAVAIALGTVTFTALGLLLGGTLKAEVVLALANVIWFLLLAVGSLVLFTDSVPQFWVDVARSLPSGALAHALKSANDGVFDPLSLLVLAVWAGAAGGAAGRFFKFT